MINYQKSEINFEYKGFGYIKTLQNNYHSGCSTHLAYLINDPSKKVIIKQFSFAKEGNNWGGLKSIEREIQNLKKLDHPQISRYITSFENNSSFCLVATYIEGENLADAKDKITPSLAHKIIEQLLDILIYLQSKNIIHQDIKPHNLILDKENKVHVIDFGLARSDSNKVLSVSSSFSGTQGFIAPEKIYKSETNPSTDIYSLAITYYCLLTKSSQEDLFAKLDPGSGIPNIRKDLKSIVSPDVVDWITKAANRKIDDRFANAKSAKNKFKFINLKKQDREKENHKPKLKTKSKTKSPVPKVPFDAKGLLEMLAFLLTALLAGQILFSIMIPELERTVEEIQRPD